MQFRKNIIYKSSLIFLLSFIFYLKDKDIVKAETNLTPIFYESFDSITSIDSNNGTYTIAPSDLIQGKNGNGVSVPVGKYLNFPVANNLSFQKGTISYWIKTNWNGDDPSTIGGRFFFSAQSGTNGKDKLASFRYYDPTYNGMFSNRVDYEPGGSGYWSEATTWKLTSFDKDQTVFNPADWKNTNWHQIEMFWDFTLTDTSKRYTGIGIDKKYYKFTYFNPSFSSTPERFYIGSPSDLDSRYYADAIIDDFTIYNESLFSPIYDPKNTQTEDVFKQYFKNDSVCNTFENYTSSPADCQKLSESINSNEQILFFKKPSFERVYANTVPLESDISNNITYRQAKGEIQNLFFNVYSRLNLSNISINYTAFEGSNGNIPKDNMDLRIVKNWFQSGTSPQKSNLPYYTPELLLNDDTIALENQVFSSANLPSLPKLDYAKSTMPIFSTKQFSLVVKVPENIPDGIYQSIVTFSSPEITDKQLILTLEVLPFILKDSQRIIALYYDSRLSNSSYHISSDVMQKELKDISDHGFNGARLSSEDTINLYQEKFDYVKNNNLYNTIMEPNATSSLKELLSQNSLAPYFYGMDEPNEESKMRTHINESLLAQSVGGKIGVAITKEWADKLDNPNDAIYDDFPEGTYTPLDWENLLVNYAPDKQYFIDLINKNVFKKSDRINTYYWQMMQEKPQINRFFSGYYLLNTHEDGIFPFAYQRYMNSDPYNDFITENNYRNHFVTYPSQEGPIPTLQWDALRAGINDLRYINTWQYYYDQVYPINQSLALNSKNIIDNIFNNYKDIETSQMIEMELYENDRETVIDEILRLLEESSDAVAPSTPSNLTVI